VATDTPQLKRPLYGPDHEKGPTKGEDVLVVKNGLWRHPALDFGRPKAGFDTVFNRRTSEAVKQLQRLQGIPDSGDVGQKTFDEIWPFIDAYRRLRYRLFKVPEAEPKSKLPELGPVVEGGKSVLEHDLTHATGGLDGYPAFDDGFRSGAVVVAPETLTITGIGSARRRDGNPNGLSIHATGESGIRYWFGHVEQPPTHGTRVGKGRRLAVVSGNHEAPHLHVGLDVSRLTGRELEHHTDYTHGGRTVGEQLAR
jgi:hypothetical protein